MLKSLDILIGLVVILLALSMAVTVITQCITAVVNSRGRHLRRGLVDLLQQLDPALSQTLSQEVATKILSHPLVSGSNTPIAGGSSGLTSWLNRVRRAIGGPRLGNVIHREEFTKLLMALAAGQGTTEIEFEARAALVKALQSNGVADPADALMARQNQAILRAAESDLVAKINNWFDQTMGRTSQRFTASTRAITFAGAFIVAFGLQVDTTAIVNRLAADDQLRNTFVSEAAAVYATGTDSPPVDPFAPAGRPPASLAPEDVARRYQAFLATNGLIRIPSSGLVRWWVDFRDLNLLGVLLTALLLSLGAPFWYSTLGGLLQLRSALATKDDAQRAERQQADSSTALANPTLRTPG
jgi:hypothetical protein